METFTHSLNWFEISVSDFDRAKKFYSTIYDYEMPENMMGNTRMGFFLMDFEKQGVGGSICFGEGYIPSAEGSLIYLNGGADLNIILNRIEGAGGQVLVPKTLINEDIGFFAIFTDTEGNRLALHSRS